MTNFVASAKKFIKSEDAPTMVEYGLLVALIAIVVAAAAARPWARTSPTLFTATAQARSEIRVDLKPRCQHLRRSSSLIRAGKRIASLWGWRASPCVPSFAVEGLSPTNPVPRDDTASTCC